MAYTSFFSSMPQTAPFYTIANFHIILVDFSLPIPYN